MGTRTRLGELELVLLLALMRLGDGAYGAAIREEVLKTTGREITPGAIYPTLDRLESRGLIRSHVGEPTGERGGRSRRHFTLLKPGLQEVRAAWREFSALTRGLERALDRGGVR